MPVQATNVGTRLRAQVETLGRDVAVSKNGEDEENGRQIRPHVEPPRSGLDNLCIVDVAIAR